MALVAGAVGEAALLLKYMYNHCLNYGRTHTPNVLARPFKRNKEREAKVVYSGGEKIRRQRKYRKKKSTFLEVRKEGGKLNLVGRGFWPEVSNLRVI